jgi:hypothetical protein
MGVEAARLFDVKWFDVQRFDDGATVAGHVPQTSSVRR